MLMQEKMQVKSDSHMEILRTFPRVGLWTIGKKDCFFFCPQEKTKYTEGPWNTNVKLQGAAAETDESRTLQVADVQECEQTYSNFRRTERKGQKEHRKSIVLQCDRDFEESEKVVLHATQQFEGVAQAVGATGFPRGPPTGWTQKENKMEAIMDLLRDSRNQVQNLEVDMLARLVVESGFASSEDAVVEWKV